MKLSFKVSFQPKTQKKKKKKSVHYPHAETLGGPQRGSQGKLTEGRGSEGEVVVHELPPGDDEERDGVVVVASVAVDAG